VSSGTTVFRRLTCREVVVSRVDRRRSSANKVLMQLARNESFPVTQSRASSGLKSPPAELRMQEDQSHSKMSVSMEPTRVNTDDVPIRAIEETPPAAKRHSQASSPSHDDVSIQGKEMFQFKERMSWTRQTPCTAWTHWIHCIRPTRWILSMQWTL
jgi:hypothetical protein